MRHHDFDSAKSGMADQTPSPDAPLTDAHLADAMNTRHVAVKQGRIMSTDLFNDTREIIIQHGEMAYRLRLTAQDKLILTK